jgi:DNA-binding CsgD family transcriptional regulator
MIDDMLSAGLSGREMEMLRLLIDGLGNQEIAERMGVSVRTAQAHVANAMRKTGTRTRTQLAVYALRAGLVPLHDLSVRDG